MIKGTTQTGFDYAIDDKRLNNYELLEYIGAVEENPLLVPKIVSLLLGDEAQALKEHVRDADGIVSVDGMTAELQDILQQEKVKK